MRVECGNPQCRRAIGHRDHANALELQVEHQLKHQEIVASKTREVLDQNGLEETVAGSLTQPIEAPAVPGGAGDRLVGVDVIFKNEPSRARPRPAGRTESESSMLSGRWFSELKRA